jgi:hypothetical protein
MPAFLVQIDGYDPAAGAPVTLRGSSVDDERVCHLGDQIWWPGIAKLPSLRYDLVDGGFSGRIDAPASSLRLAVEGLGPTAANLPRYALADARVRLWSGQIGAAWGSYTLRFDGRAMAQARVADGLAELPIAVDDRWLDTPLLSLYAGTTGAEGEAALKGSPKPLSIGAPRFVPGKLIDTVNNVYQLSSYGQIEAVEVAFERLLRFGSSVGDFASYAALVAASIPAGRWATSLAAGLVRHGAPPVSGGRFAYHVRGDKAGPDGWVRLPGAVIKRLALLAGGSGRINEASVDALDAARPWPISIHLAEQVTARELIQRVAASVNAVAGVSWTSQLFVAPIGFSAPSLALDAGGASLPPVARVEQIEIDSPFHRLGIETEVTHDVHALSDVAFTSVLVERGDYQAGETYREGHIVQQQGSSWLYVNPTPASGNAPPMLPTESNAYWRVLARAGQNGAPGAPGAPGDPGAPGAPGQAAPQTMFQWSVNGTSGWHADYAVGDLYLRSSTDGGSTWSAAARVVGADGLSFDLSILSVTVLANSDGTVKDSELPRSITATLKAGATDLTASATFSRPAAAGNTSSIATNVLTITGVSADGFADVRCQYGAFDQTKRVQILKKADAPPPASVTPPAGGYSTSQSSSTFAQVTASTYPASPNQVLTLRADGSGVLRGVLFLEYTPPRPGSAITLVFRLVGKLVYRLAGSGGAWADFAAEQQGSESSNTGGLEGEAETGVLSFTVDKTGLTAGADYEVGFMGRKASSSQSSTSPYGSLTVKQPGA